ncbi:chemotaxis protein CheB [Rufibacter immobilis]|uniref:chemotaxis protein CheB n=1 Tax=Rufibacter immobilis TaxID=1348778 RepID=UPI0035E7B6C1
MQQTQRDKIRVLIGDTSVRSRLVLSGMIDAEPHLEVIDTAKSKEELLDKAFSAKPDLIVAHYELTVSGSLPLFETVNGGDSSMLLMVSQEMAVETSSFPKKAVAVRRPLGQNSYRVAGDSVKARLMSSLKDFLIKYSVVKASTRKKKEVLTTGERKLHYHHLWSTAVARAEVPLNVVVVGASTGGSTAIEYLIKEINVQQPTVVLVAVHMPEKFTKRLARRLQKLTTWRVEEGYEGMKLTSNTVVIAPGGQNMRVCNSPLFPNQLSVKLERSNAMDTPSVDVLMLSAAQCAHEQVLGIILTGMGTDGTVGAQEIKKRGGIVIAQNEETSTIFGMAKSAIENGYVHGVLALGQINSIINRFAANRSRNHMLQRKAIG